MSVTNFNIKGLTQKEVLISKEKYDANKLEYKKENPFLNAFISLVKESMGMLLLVTSSIYFISGNNGDGTFLACAIVLISAISLHQGSRSRNALEKLKTFMKPNCKVVRDEKTVEIKTEELVVRDYILLYSNYFFLYFVF